MKALPKRLKDDAILEALFELRFEHSEMSEVAFARLADLSRWSGFKTTRLPAANLPAEFRTSDPNLLFQATAQLVSPDRPYIIRLGPNVISIHNTKKYEGWSSGFADSIHGLISDVFAALPTLQVARIGLRYINMFVHTKHGISSPFELNLSLHVGGIEISRLFHLTFTDRDEVGFEVKTQIATPDLLNGQIPDGSSVLVDIDVFSSNEAHLKTDKDVSDWVTKAHELEKKKFFGLLPQKKIDELREE